MLFFGSSNPTSKLSHFASPSSATKDVKEYDYIIVGGGTAGSVLASRLSEDPKTRVLVIEAGTDNAGVLESRIPLMFNKLFHTKRDWDYYTAPQSNVMSRELYWPRGKMLGGSSSLNAMMASHPAPDDLNHWAQNLQCKGWGYSDIAPYLRKVEKYTPNPDKPMLDAEHRGDSGFWHTGHNGHINEVSEKGFLPACEEVGIPSASDINTPKGLLGAVRFMTFIDPTGERSSAATAYLPNEVRARPNLTLAVETLVTRVLFRTGAGEPVAYGVEVQGKKDGPLYKAHAAREVILCGGAINTPQTLKLSGVGPAAELSAFGIPVVVDSPAVGEHLLDHFCTSSMTAKAKPGVTMNHLASTIRALPSLAQWMLTGKGSLASNIGEAAAFINAAKEAKRFGWKNVPEDNCSGPDAPDVELIAAPLAFIDHGEAVLPPGEDPITIIPIGLRPKSEGVIKLRTASVWDKPLIDPRYWSDPEDNDRKVLLIGTRICLKILHSEAYAKFLEPVPPSSDPNNFYWPWCDPDPDNIHPVSSCRMRNDIKEGVVDTSLKVHGTKGLRICDASIFPDQVSTHPTWTVLAIAERCADLIQGKPTLSQPSAARL